jgi:hypothetical protein
MARCDLPGSLSDSNSSKTHCPFRSGTRVSITGHASNLGILENRGVEEHRFFGLALL